MFEVITPAVIAGVEGTKFNVNNQYYIEDGVPQDKTFISVTEGNVNVEERNQGRMEKVKQNEEISVTTRTYEAKEKGVPRKPPQAIPYIIKKIK
jgi:hypothetical protein